MSVLLVAALLPLALAGFGSWIVFGKLLERESLTVMKMAVESHAEALEAHLSEQLRLLRLLAESHLLDDFTRPGNLEKMFDDLNRSSTGGFVDLGVIDLEGRHLAYIGPYDLRSRNYSQTDWFKEVNIKGEYISDVFPGFRQVPHCIIAVKIVESGRSWILRATINSARFDSLVKAGGLGEGSAVYIVNREGYYQTTPPGGALLDKAPDSLITSDAGLRERRMTDNGKEKLRVTTWINDGRWMLVVERDLDAIQAPVNEAIAEGAYAVLLAAVVMVLITFLSTRYLTGRIEKTAAEREELSRALLRSAKLASIGELTTGLAHEINNPLAIISAEQTNISDLIRESDPDRQKLEQIVNSVKRCQAQIKRCTDITKKLLQFGRSQEPKKEFTDIVSRLSEVKNLMDRHARARDIAIDIRVRENLPKVLLDPVELEQVLVNLVNNSIDAISGRGEILMESYRDGDSVLIDIKDNGQGIPAGMLDRVFEPFFTTKPVGKGTGLGLSVCYGIVRSWGGSIEAISAGGKGTTMRITVPIPPEGEQEH
jgi:two-component system NtrC family sensor kinase